MKKSLNKIVLLIAVVITTMVCFVFSAGAATAGGKCGNNVYWNYNTETKELVISGSGDMYNYKDYDKSPFSNYKDGIETLVINKGVTSIGNVAFMNFDSIKSVIIPDGVVSIGYMAFYGCRGLTDITIPSSVTRIGAYAFQYCESLTSIKMLNGLTELGDMSFSYCEKLDSIILPDNITSIGDYVFSGTAYYEDKANWNDGGLYINKYLLGVEDDFSGVFTIKNGTRLIADSAFAGKSITSVIIPDTVTSIGDYCFYRCDDLLGIKIPNSVTSIGEDAFYHYNSFYSKYDKFLIYCRKGSYAASYAFANEEKIEVVYLDATDEESVVNRTINNINYYLDIRTGILEISGRGNTDTLGFGGESWLSTYKLYITDVRLSEGITGIGQYDFSGLNRIHKITIPDSVTSIGWMSFSGCCNLREIKIPDKVTSIYGRAFSGCEKLAKIILPDNITIIEGEVFNATAYSRDKANWEDGGLYINKYLLDVENDFSGAFTVKKGTRLIAGEAFWDCTNITSVVIPDTVMSIGDYCFRDCSNLLSVKIPYSVKNIGEFAFSGCESAVIYYAGDIYQWKKVEGWDKNPDYINVVTQPHTHTEITVKGKDATCSVTGLTDGKKCTGCSVMTVPQKNIAKKAHTYSNTCDTTCNVCKATRSIKHTYSNSCDTSCNVCKATRKITHSYKTIATTKASLSKNGKTTTKCAVCGNVSGTKTVYKIKSVKLSATSYTYNGKTRKPKVTVKDSKGNTLKKDTDYTVKYSSGCKNLGKYTVTVTFKGKYEGTKKLTFTIKPKAVTLSKVTAGSKQLTVTWKTVSGATGYEVQYSTSSKFKNAKTATVSKGSSKKTTIKKLTKGKKYYVKVRAYKTVDGKKIYGAWSEVKNVKVK